MAYRDGSIFNSDEELFWSEPEDEVDDSRPVCMGCLCRQKTCENRLPSFGYVQWNSLWDVQDYIELSARLQTIGVKLQYQCLSCLNCEECIPTQKIFLKSLEYQVITGNFSLTGTRTNKLLTNLVVPSRSALSNHGKLSIVRYPTYEHVDTYLKVRFNILFITEKSIRCCKLWECS